MDRGVFVDRTEAERTTVGELIDRYIQEVTPLKRSARNDKQRMLFLKRHFGHFIVSQLQSKHIASYRDKRLAEGKQGATVVKEIGSMSHLLDIAIKDWGIPLTSNVATLIRKPKQSTGRDRRLVDDKEQILMQAAKNSKSPLLQSIFIKMAKHRPEQTNCPITYHQEWRISHCLAKLSSDNGPQMGLIDADNAIFAASDVSFVHCNYSA